MARILVTGVGAIIGYGIIRSLKLHDHQVIGMDIYDDAVGRHWCDEFVQAKYTSDPDYPAFLQDVLKTYRPDLVIPGIEQDVHAYDELRKIFAGLNVKACLNNSTLIQLGKDKWLIHETEIAHGIVAIPSSLENNFDSLSREFGLPFLLKPRKSYAGKGTVLVQDEKTFSFYKNRVGDLLMVQKQIGSDEDEYTVSVFGDGLGHYKASIQLRRTLSQEGATQKAWRVEDRHLEESADRLEAVDRYDRRDAVAGRRRDARRDPHSATPHRSGVSVR